MDEYLGLSIRLTLHDQELIEGIVSEIKVETNSITLSNAKSTRLNASLPFKYLDTVTVKGSDIVDLEIIPAVETVPKPPAAASPPFTTTIADASVPPGFDAPSPTIKKPAGNMLNAVDLERDLQQYGIHSYAKTSMDPAILSLSTYSSKGEFMANAIGDDLGALQLNPIAKDLAYSKPHTTCHQQHVKEVSHWISTDVNKYADSDFDFEQNLKQFDKKKAFEEYKTSLKAAKEQTLAAVNKPDEKKTEKLAAEKPVAIPAFVPETMTLKKERAPHEDRCGVLYSREGKVFPLLSAHQLNKVITYATNRCGPNTVQMIENGARSFIEWFQNVNLITSNKEDPPMKRFLLLCGAHKMGAMALAIGRHLLNRGHFVIAFLVPDEHAHFEELNEKDEAERQSKSVLFQKEIATKHEMTILTSLHELSSHLKNECHFHFIIDAMTLTNTAQTESVSVGLVLKNYLVTRDRTNTAIVSLGIPSTIRSDETSTSSVPLLSQCVLTFGMPAVSTLMAIKAGRKKAKTELDLPRIFNLDLGISPRLWVKFKAASTADALELSLKDLVDVYHHAGYFELFYTNEKPAHDHLY